MNEEGDVDRRICPIKVFVEEELRHMCPWHFPGLVSAKDTLGLYCADPYLDRVDATDETQAWQSIRQSLAILEDIHKRGLRRDLVDIDTLLRLR